MRKTPDPTSVTELAEPLHLALPSAVKHLAILAQGGFVASNKTGCVRTFQIEPKAFGAMASWMAKYKPKRGGQ